MKAQELRLRNLVYDTGGKVNTINMDAFKYLLSYGDTDICQVKPIPLTEEWLLKFGLIKVKNIDEDSIWMFNDINFTYETERCLVILDRYIISVCKYVHQLQNLYFALTGEELTINEKSPTI